MSTLTANNYTDLPFNGVVDFDIITEFEDDRTRICSLLNDHRFLAPIKENKLKHIFYPDDEHSCDYYDNEKLKQTKLMSSDSLNILTLNIRSLPKHAGELLCFLASLTCRFHIIILTEIGARNIGTVEHLMSNYRFFYVIPTRNMFGGVGIFVSDELTDVAVAEDLELKQTCQCDKCNFESLFLDVKFGNECFTIGGIYRHPGGNITHFVDVLEASLIKMNNSNTCIFAGDLNVNIMNYEGHHELQYLSMLLSHKFLPQITLPTRITETTATCIDHIFVRLPLTKSFYNCRSGLFYCDISDHLPCFVSISSIKREKTRPFTRIFGTANCQKFSDKMSSTNWNAIYTNDNDWYTAFISQIVKYYNECFPLVIVSRKRSKDKPWITTGLKISVRHNYRLYKKSIRVGTTLAKNTYERYNKLLRRSIRNAQDNYYKELFTNKKNSVYNMWKTLGVIVNPGKKRKGHDINKISSNGKMITNKNQIANIINEHFCSVGDRLVEGLPNNLNLNFKQYLPDPILNSFFLRPILREEIIKEIKLLNPRKSSGPDKIPVKLIQLCPEIFADNLAIIYNKAIESAVYPDDMKIARVVALFKKGERHSADNYRPISLLSCINKLFEKLVCKQLLAYCEANNIFYDFQFGFRKRYSTSHALIETVDSIRRLVDEGNYVMGLFVDLTKAFDTVNHEILLYKMNNYGIRGHANNFFGSYLSNRKQYMSVNGTESKLSSINCGVPQGSVLGPILFLLYINDIYRALKDCKINLFADDTCVFVSDPSMKDLMTKSKNQLSNLYKWCVSNKLTMNSTKTCYIIFHTKNKRKYLNITKMETTDICIERVFSVKYLGVILDSLLTWKDHINYVCGKLLKYFGIFNHIKTFVSKSIARQLYFAFVYSTISYGIEVYGSCCQTLLTKVQVIQNRLLKLLLRMDRMSSTNFVHKYLHLLKVKDIYSINILCFTNNCMLGQCPGIFQDYFKLREQIYEFRQVSLYIPRFRTEQGSLRADIQGAKLWNNLTDEIKKYRYQLNFRKHLAKHLINGYEDA